MPIKIVDPDTGAETEAFTQAELEAREAAIKAEADKKIADNEAHMAQKLDEFQKGKTATELEKEAERNKTAAEIAEARKIAEAAAATVAASEARRLEGLKKMAFQRFVGDDAELNKKLEDAWAVINFDPKDEADFVKKAEMAANMSGLNAPPNLAAGMSFGGSFAPGFKPSQKKIDETAHQTFRSALPGMDDFLAKPNEDKK